jgi:hypothetical protein
MRERLMRRHPWSSLRRAEINLKTANALGNPGDVSYERTLVIE